MGTMIVNSKFKSWLDLFERDVMFFWIKKIKNTAALNDEHLRFKQKILN